MSSILEIYSIQRELEELNRNLSKVESQIAELKEALKWAKELHPKAVYRVFGNRIALEVSSENIEEVINSEIEKLEKVRRLLTSRREELLEKLRRLGVGTS